MKQGNTENPNAAGFQPQSIVTTQSETDSGLFEAYWGQGSSEKGGVGGLIFVFAEGNVV